jgi:hypothetical protein
LTFELKYVIRIWVHNMDLNMNFLSIVFIVKITMTAIFLAMPLLCLPASRLSTIFEIETTTTSPAIFRLYGVAIAALLTGYAFGLASAFDGSFPTGPVWMGIVSNLGAAGLLAAGGRRRRTLPAIIFFGSVGLALVLAAAAPHTALGPLF